MQTISGLTPPRSGWDVYREDQRKIVIAEGYTGKDISSQIGARWRSLSGSEKEAYKIKAMMRASLIGALMEQSTELERSVTVSGFKRNQNKNGCRRKSI